jgi:anti-sigma-K factor RskA
MNLPDQEELWVKAGEYVLGVLTSQEVAEFERQIATDQELQVAVRYWEEHLLGLTAIAEPVPAPPELWQRIERNLALPPTPSRNCSFTLAHLWQNISFWRWTTGFATSIALAALTVVISSTQQRAEFSVVLGAPDKKTATWLVQEAGNNQLRITPLVETPVPAGRALQLWTLADRQQGPVTLGLIPSDRSILIPAERLPGLKSGQFFEITLEPEQGSYRPTGPVLFVGWAAQS